MPDTAATVVVPLMPPDPDATDTVTAVVDDVTVLPPASCTATTGCVGTAVFVTALDGLVVNCSAAGLPTATVIVLESTLSDGPVSGVVVAVSV